MDTLSPYLAAAFGLPTSGVEAGATHAADPTLTNGSTAISPVKGTHSGGGSGNATLDSLQGLSPRGLPQTSPTPHDHAAGGSETPGSNMGTQTLNSATSLGSIGDTSSTNSFITANLGTPSTTVAPKAAS